MKPESFYIKPEEQPTPESEEHGDVLDLQQTPWYISAAEAVLEKNPRGRGEGETLANGTFPVTKMRVNGATEILLDADEDVRVWISPRIAKQARQAG